MSLCSVPRCSGGSCCSSFQSTMYLSSPASSAPQSSSCWGGHHPHRLLPACRAGAALPTTAGSLHGVPGACTPLLKHSPAWLASQGIEVIKTQEAPPNLPTTSIFFFLDVALGKVRRDSCVLLGCVLPCSASMQETKSTFWGLFGKRSSSAKFYKL